MNYTKIGATIRTIREKDLKITREEFAEEIGISTLTVARLENATRKVTNIETYSKISCITGYTLEELIGGTNCLHKDIRNRFDYILNTLSNEELEYLYNYVRTFTKFLNNRRFN